MRLTTSLALTSALLTLACGERQPAAPAAVHTLGDPTPTMVAYGSPRMMVRAGDGTPSAVPLGRARRGPSTSAAASGVSATSAAADPNTFDNFIRQPAETAEQGGYFEATKGDSAYFRDLFVGASVTLSQPNDGDTYTASVTLPSGSVVNWSTTTYHKEWNGQQDCWVDGMSSLCDATWIWVDYYRGSQCGETGAWKWSLKHNGVSYKDTTLRVLRQLDLDKMGAIINQGSYQNTSYDHICGGRNKPTRICKTGDTDSLTIQRKGCAISAATMVLNYHSIDLSVDALNTYLEGVKDNPATGQDDGGYVGKGSTNWDYVSLYARQLLGRDFRNSYAYQTDTTVASLMSLICKYGPQVIQTKDGGHFVTAVGYDSVKKSVIVHDPNGGVRLTLDSPSREYHNKFQGIRLLMGPEKSYTLPQSNIVVSFHSPGEIVLTDPQGRRVGYDPTTGTRYAEVPGGAYTLEGMDFVDDDGSFIPDEKSKFATVSGPVDGQYKVTVVGTGTGTYILSIRTHGEGPDLMSGTSFRDVPITPGEVHSYTFSYSATSASTGIEVAGGFTGGGQRSDVDELLSYVAPSERQVHLPAGTTSYTLRIVYGMGIAPATFSAAFEGTDVTARFHPAPGTQEAVTLPLASGRNVLKLSTRGTVGTRDVSDSDQLVFIVP